MNSLVLFFYLFWPTCIYFLYFNLSACQHFHTMRETNITILTVWESLSGMAFLREGSLPQALSNFSTDCHVILNCKFFNLGGMYFHFPMQICHVIAKN